MKAIAAAVEWLLSDRSRGLRRRARQWARRADSRPSRPRSGTGRFDPHQTFVPAPWNG